MKVADYRRISKTDLQEAPAWMHRIVDQTNQQIEIVTTAVQRNLTFSENFNSEIRSISLADDTTTRISLNALKGKPIGAILVDSGYAYARLAWQVVDESTVDVKVKWDVAPAVDTEVVILFLGS